MPKQKKRYRPSFPWLTQPSLPLLLVLLGLILLFTACFARWELQQFKLQLPQTFYAEEDGIYKILDFDEDTVTYRLEVPNAPSPIVMGTYPYEVVASGTIRLCRFGEEYETFSLSFHQKGTALTISPALTEDAPREIVLNAHSP